MNKALDFVKGDSMPNNQRTAAQGDLTTGRNRQATNQSDQRRSTPMPTLEQAKQMARGSWPTEWDVDPAEALVVLAERVRDLEEDAARYRWFRDDCGMERQLEIVEASEGVSYMLEHHIDKGRCGI